MVDTVSTFGNNQTIATKIAKGGNTSLRPTSQESINSENRSDVTTADAQNVLRNVINTLADGAVRNALSNDRSAPPEITEREIRANVAETLSRSFTEHFGENASGLINGSGKIDIDALKSVLRQQSEDFNNLVGKPSFDEVIAEALNSAYTGSEKTLIEIDA